MVWAVLLNLFSTKRCIIAVFPTPELPIITIFISLRWVSLRRYTIFLRFLHFCLGKTARSSYTALYLLRYSRATPRELPDFQFLIRFCVASCSSKNVLEIRIEQCFQNWRNYLPSGTLVVLFMPKSHFVNVQLTIPELHSRGGAKWRRHSPGMQGREKKSNWLVSFVPEHPILSLSSITSDSTMTQLLDLVTAVPTTTDDEKVRFK